MGRAGRPFPPLGIERIRAGEPRVVVLEKTPMPGTKVNAELLLEGWDVATGQVGHGRDGRDLAPTNAAMPNLVLGQGARDCGCGIGEVVRLGGSDDRRQHDWLGQTARPSRPMGNHERARGRGDTTDQLRTTTAALSALRRLTMDNSDKWFRLDNHGHPILGSRGREFKSRQPGTLGLSEATWPARLGLSQLRVSREFHLTPVRAVPRPLAAVPSALLVQRDIGR